MQMNRRSIRDSVLSSDRQTTWRLSSRSQENQFGLLRYNHMLNEDVNASIIPYRSYSKQRETPLAQLSLPNDLVKEDISIVLSDHEDRHNSLEDAVSDFIRKCAGTMMHEGQAIYEIVNYVEQGNPESAFSKLEYVPSRNIKFLFGQPFQILPELEDFEVKEPRFKKITKNKLVIFRMPKPYRANLKAMRLQLDKVGKDGVENLYFRALEEPGRQDKKSLSNKINIMNVYKYSELAVLFSTNSIGWNARDTQSKYMQEYFSLIRFLKFERFKLSLRNSILDTLNDNLSRLLSDPTYDGCLQLNGLPKEEDIKQAEEDLREGKRGFNDIITPFYR